MNSYQLIFPESGVLWCSQVLDLSLLPLVFCLILIVSSRLLHPYSTNDKTSRLMVKRFSTVRDTQRGSQTYMEKGRGRREREVTRRRRGESKGERAIYPVINSLCALHSLDPSEKFTKLHREEKREEGDRGDQETSGNQKERDRSSQESVP